MKKMMTAVALLGLSLPVMAQALEFQTPGALGMGRAGVARTTDAYATFINPAGLQPMGQNLYTETAASGQPASGTAGTLAIHGSATFASSYTLTTISAKPVCKVVPATHVLPPDTGASGGPHPVTPSP